MFKGQLKYFLTGTAIAVIALVFAVVAIANFFLRSSSPTDGVLHQRETHSSDEQEHVRAIADITRQRVIDKVQPAIDRVQLIARSPEV